MSEELDAEYKALLREQADLDAEHARLKLQTRDIQAHRDHARRLREHIDRLHRFIHARAKNEGR